MKALILAAGFGTRLQPFTKHIPKPLCPFFGVAFLDLALHRVLPHVDEVVINTHHLSPQIRHHIETFWQDAPISISEEKTIRGTGGALFPLKKWLGDQDLLIYNADIISNIDIVGLINKHRTHDPEATMMMLKEPSPGKTPIFCKEGYVISIADQPKSHDIETTFSGIHIVSNSFVQTIPCDVPWNIIDTYNDCLMANKPIKFDIHSGFWEDLGTPLSLWHGHHKVIKSGAYELLDSLGITMIRQQRSRPRIEIDMENESAWTENLEFDLVPKESFIESEIPIQCSISKSILVHMTSLSSQPIQNLISINNISALHS